MLGSDLGLSGIDDCHSAAGVDMIGTRSLPEDHRVATVMGCQSPNAVEDVAKQWFAVFTIPQNEKSVARHLVQRQIEHFLPTFRTFRLWRNRQRAQVFLPLFPSYLFVRIGRKERASVLSCPGVIRIVGSSCGPISIPESTIALLRSGTYLEKIEPHYGLVEGNRVRIRRGSMKGVEGVLSKSSDNLKFVLTIELIQRHFAFTVDACDLEAIH